MDTEGVTEAFNLLHVGENQNLEGGAHVLIWKT